MHLLSMPSSIKEKNYFSKLCLICPTKLNRHPKRKVVFPYSPTTSMHASYLKITRINFIKSIYTFNKFSLPTTIFVADYCEEMLLEFSCLTCTLSSLMIWYLKLESINSTILFLLCQCLLTLSFHQLLS